MNTRRLFSARKHVPDSAIVCGFGLAFSLFLAACDSSCNLQTQSSMTKHFHHIGIVTDEPQPGETYVEDTKVWVTDPADHPQRIEYLRFEADSPVTGPLRNMAHIAYRVDDLEAAIAGEEILLEPFVPMPGLSVAFIMKDGAVIEYMQFKPGATEFSHLDQAD